MSVSIYFGTVSKRKNSTYQPTLSDNFSCELKAPTDIDRPTLLLSAASFSYNYAKWDDRYYFVTAVVSVRNGQWEVSMELDPLATYKAEILASTQFVCYSSASGGTWLPDTRVPITKETQVDSDSSVIPIFDSSGFYVLTATGEKGCNSYIFTGTQLQQLLQNITNWGNQGVSWATDISGYTYPTNEIEAILLASTVLTKSGYFSNSYQEAPNQIRSCIWVPFSAGSFNIGTPTAFYLGGYDCGLSPLPNFCAATPAIGSVSVNIPWHYSDWRRSLCEDVYLYLPMVGYVTLSGDSLTHVSSLTINYSATATDGVICYEVLAGGVTIGTYGGQCSANYPIGVSQQASAGQIALSVLGGGEKIISNGVNSSISSLSGASAGVGMVFSGVNSIIDVIQTASSRHNVTVGGVGGGAGIGLSVSAECSTVAHPTLINPSSMASTMGVPTMQPMSLSGLSGYCQCANAHVEAPAQGPELDQIDAYLNTGFYIE